MSAKLVGGTDVLAAVRALGDFASQAVCEKALLAVGKPMAEKVGARFEALSEPPEETGLTKKDFRAVVSKQGRQTGETKVLVGARQGKKGRYFIFRFREFGTAHMAARPAMRPVWDEEKTHVAAEVTKQLRPAYEATVKRLARFARSRGHAA
jgi:HK97 gp10 family phage protein